VGPIVKKVEKPSPLHLHFYSFGQEALERNLSLVRSIRPNRVGILKELKTVSHRELNSTTVFWEKDKIKITFNSYRVKRKIKRKNVNILSTFPPVQSLMMTKNQ